MDIQFVSITHGTLALVAVGCLSFHRLRHIAIAMFAIACHDAAFFWSKASWQAETAVAFVGPVAALLAVSRTVGASLFWSTIISAPVIATAAACVARGVDLGVPGIAWCLAFSNVYVATAGLLLLRIGARQISRLAAVTSGLLTATSAPAIVGWILLARGHSVRAATVIDCVFLFAIVVSSLAEWTHRCPICSSPQSQVPSSGR